MSSPEFPIPKPSRRRPAAAGPLLALCALLLAAAALTEAAAAKPIKYSSYIKGATAFRDANRNGEADDALQTTTAEDGSFELVKGKGRLYLKGGTDIRTGKPNTTLLTAPPASRAIGTLSSLWQALLDRRKKNKAIRTVLAVPANASLADFTAAPVSGIAGKPKSKVRTQALVKKDAQHETLVQFLKALGRRPGPSLKAYRPQATRPPLPEDGEIGALAEALLANGTRQSPDLTDLATVRTTFAAAANDPDLGIEPPPAEVLDLLAVAMASLNESVEQLGGNSPPADQLAIEERLADETDTLATAIGSGEFEPFRQIAFPPPVIAGISVDSGPDANDRITNDTTPTLFGTVDRAANLVRVYTVDTETGAPTQLADVAPDATGSWSYTSAQLNDGSHRFAVTGVAQFGTEVETEPSEITVTVDGTAPSDGSLAVDSLTTNIRTPTLTGTWDPAQGNTLSVTVNGIAYTSANGLDLSQGASWRLTIPQNHQLPDGDHDVRAVVADAAGNTSADTTTNELRIEFAPATSIAVGAVPRALIFTNVDGDGQTDLVVANQNANRVSVLLGNGDSSFQAAAEFPAGGAPVALASGDMDGDGDADLVVANFAGTVSVLINDGAGGFSQPQPAGYAAGSKPSAVALGHFNGDALLDAAVADTGSDSLVILLNNGSGGFDAPVQLAAGALPYAVAAADLDGDQATDVVVVNRNGNSVSAFLGNGDGSFQAKRDHPVGSEPAALALGDLDGDGNPDLAVAGGCCKLAIALGNGDGSFQPASFHATGNYPYAVVIADLGGDTAADVATANWGSDSVSVLLGDGAGGFGSSLALGAGAHPIALAAGDVNSDGRPDLMAVANYSSNTVSLLAINPVATE